MATNRDLLKEAIADAKAVKETAIANAKAALTESFTPFLREKLSEKIQAMDEEDDAETEYDNAEADVNDLDEISLDELLAELEENDSKEMEEENLYEAKEEEEDEEMSIEDMDEDDLKSFIEDVIKDMVSAGELEAGHEGMENEEGAEEEEMEAPEEEEEMESEEEEVDLEELLAEIEEGDEELEEASFGLGAKLKGALGLGAGKEEDFLKAVEKTSNKMLANKKKAEYDEFKKKAEAGDEMAKKIIAGIIKHAGSNEDLFYMINPTTGEVKQTKSYSVKDSGVQMGEGELEEAYAAIKTLQSELNEINLLNSKLLYTNKIFRSKSLSESQKIKVLTAFDKAKNKKEAQLVYETLLESLKASTIGAKTSIKESLGSASKSLGSANAKPIIDVDNQFARWQTLAGINKK